MPRNSPKNHTGNTTINAGTLTFGAAMTYTGSTTINSGTFILTAAGQLGSGVYAGAFTNNSAFVSSATANQTFSGVVSGTGSFTKTGSGVLTLTNAANSFTSGLAVSAGTVQVGSNTALGTGTLTLTGGALSSNGATARSIANAVAVAGNVTLGDATNTGILTLTGGVDLGGAVRQVTTPSNVTIASAVTSGGLTKAGAGALTLSASNAFAGGLTVSAGMVRIGNDAALGAGGVTLNGGGLSSDGATARSVGNAVAVGGNVTLGDATNNGLLTFNGGVDLGGVTRTLTTPSDVTIASAVTNGGLTKAGAATLALTGVNTYAGDTAISSGTLRVGGSGQLGSGAYAGAISNAGVLDFASSANQTLSGSIGGGGTVVKSGAGTLTLTASNAYTGATTISAGTLALSGNGAIGSSSGVNLSGSGAVLDIAGASGGSTIGGLAGVAGSQVLLGNNTLTIGGGFFDGVIAGTGGLTKTGGGLLGLTDIQTFTGATRIEDGILSVNSATALASSNSIFTALGTTLDVTAAGLDVVSGQTLAGYGMVDGNVNFLAGSFLSPGGSVGAVTIDGNTTWNSFTYTFEVNDATGTAGQSSGWDLLTVTGSLTLAAGPEFANQIVIDLTSLSGTSPGEAANWNNNSNYAWKFVVAGSEIGTYNPAWFRLEDANFDNTPYGSFYVARGDNALVQTITGNAATSSELYVVYAAIPEPGTLVLAGLGLMGLGLAATRRRRCRGR